MEELILGFSASQPVDYHVHQFKLFSHNVVVYHVMVSRVVCLNGRWRLLVTHIFQENSFWNCFTSIDEERAKFCLSLLKHDCFDDP